MIAGILCSIEMLKDRAQQMSCDRYCQWKMACQWDLVGIIGPWDLNASKQAFRVAKTPVMNVDDIKEAGDGIVFSPAAEPSLSVFVL
jgi:hypothetical protein